MALRILIGGGTGFVGRHLTALLNEHGYEVTAISRTPAPDRITWDDIYRDGIPKDTHAVVNLSGHNIMDLNRIWDKDFEQVVRDSRIHTGQRLVAAIQAAENPPKVFVSASAVGIYPTSSTMSYDEGYAAKPIDFMTQLVQDWEKAATLPAQAKTRSAIVRIGLVLGRDGGMVQNLIIPFWLGAGGRLGPGTQWFPWVHADDVAGIIGHTIENDAVSGVLNAVAPESATNADFTREFARALWRPALFPMPEFVIKKLFGAERGALMLEGQKVLPKRTLETGYEFMYPDLKSACKECAHLMQKAGSLTF